MQFCQYSWVIGLGHELNVCWLKIKWYYFGPLKKLTILAASNNNPCTSTSSTIYTLNLNHASNLHPLDKSILIKHYYINDIHTSKLLTNYDVKKLFSIEPKVRCFQIPTLKQMKNVCILVNFLISELVSSHMHLMHQTLTTLHKLVTCSSHLVTTRKTWFLHCWVFMILANML
jgi:hypothetical protein